MWGEIMKGRTPKYGVKLEGIDGKFNVGGKDPQTKRYIAHIFYQLPRRIVLHGRSKVSPQFETLYGLMYWLKKQKYNLTYTIYSTHQDHEISSGKITYKG